MTTGDPYGGAKRVGAIGTCSWSRDVGQEAYTSAAIEISTITIPNADRASRVRRLIIDFLYT